MATRKATGIGQNLRRLRVERGMTQMQLAEAAGIADATISRIERGRLQPTVALAEQLARVLGVGLDALIGKAKREVTTKTRPAVARLLAVVRDLDDAQVDDLTRAVRLLIGVGRRSARPR